ncbi:helix-turn-helix domain-containing protein [Dubosiella newyorkensis]|uniref:helix-turn-helix domain-containing protein n=2 Tax=Dubosiella newyorkensis TaxID=1862672 RepID=UPI0024BA88D6|nr:helix-turn-helix domain-containing protein [Dubosiella newyorkensis]
MSLENLKMLTTNEVAEILNVHRNQVQMFKDQGILKGIKTGKNIMYSQREILEFQQKFKGYDISNVREIRKTIQAMNNLEENRDSGERFYV